MIDRTEHGDVTALRLSWARSRIAGYSVNVYVVRGVLVDTGFAGMADAMRALVRERALRGALVTHQHEDHAGNVQLLASLGVPIGISPATEQVIRAPYPIGAYRRLVWRTMPVLRARLEPFLDRSLTLDHAPGHCDDHHVVWDSETDTLFAGDLFLGVKVRVAHHDENPRRQVAALRSLIARRPSRVFCMHRGLVPNGVQALTAKADWMEEIIGGIERLHAQGQSVAAIRAQLLGPHSVTHHISRGRYSADNFVRAVIEGADQT